MKIALCAEGNSIDSRLSSLKKNSTCMIFYDTDSKIIEMVPLPINFSNEIIGQLMNERMPNMLVSTDFELDIKPMLDRLKIRMVVFPENGKKIHEVVDMIKNK